MAQFERECSLLLQYDINGVKESELLVSHRWLDPRCTRA